VRAVQAGGLGVNTISSVVPETGSLADRAGGVSKTTQICTGIYIKTMDKWRHTMLFHADEVRTKHHANLSVMCLVLRSLSYRIQGFYKMVERCCTLHRCL
jgi:hypothetical protein